MTSIEQRSFDQINTQGSRTPIVREIAVEQPCAVEINGLGYAVMMVTPSDLEDFAYGFCLSERLIERAEDVVTVDLHQSDAATLLRVSTAPPLRERVVDRVRHRVSDSSCGLCGIENLEQALRPLPRLPARARPLSPAAAFRAFGATEPHQPLNRLTGAMHGAMMCAADGQVLFGREDVGRHNAFDKLIGAVLRSGNGWDDKFALLTSRCSYELVEKAVLAGCATLVTISAPTTLALDRATEAGLELISLARRDSYLTAT